MREGVVDIVAKAIAFGECRAGRKEGVVAVGFKGDVIVHSSFSLCDFPIVSAALVGFGIDGFFYLGLRHTKRFANAVHDANAEFLAVAVFRHMLNNAVFLDADMTALAATGLKTNAVTGEVADELIAVQGLKYIQMCCVIARK